MNTTNVLALALLLTAPPALAAPAETPAAQSAPVAAPSPAFMAPAATPAPAEVRALVARCVAAYGGPTAIEQAAKLRQLGSVTSTMHPGEKAPLRRLYDRRRGLRVEVLWKSGPELRLLSGGRGWREGREVQGPPLQAMLLQGARLDLPAILRAAGDRVQDGGGLQHEGKTLRVLRVELGGGLTVEAGLDPVTGRILRSRGASASSPAVEFVTTYSDFREVDGALVAFREGNWANGQVTGETVLATVSFLDQVPDEAFRP